MNILAIETSCDDTCAAVLKVKSQKSKVRGKPLASRGEGAKFKNPFEVLSNIVSSQINLHQKYGGVYPMLAKREHQRNLPLVLKKALRKANFKISNFQFLISKQTSKTKLKFQDIDAIAVTVGPGLEPCLWTGINFAKELAEKMKLPIIPVNHIEAHLLINWLLLVNKTSKSVLISKQIKFPAVCLVVSGGHTQLILVTDIGKYKILGETRDDAAGECFDKTARILGLDYPGGISIAKHARQWKSDKKHKSAAYVFLPRPMIHQKNYDFSFSGLKTAVLYKTREKGFKIKDKKCLQEMCFEIQQAIIDVLIKKTLKAADNYKAKSIILGGGVSANEELRKQFREKIEKEIPYCKFYIPNPELCTDNGVMTALAGYFNQSDKKNWKKIKANANLRIDEPPLK